MSFVYESIHIDSFMIPYGFHVVLELKIPSFSLNLPNAMELRELRFANVPSTGRRAYT